MNINEAIKKVEHAVAFSLNDILTEQQVDVVYKSEVLDIISQIDEPQKVVVPKFVAEWIKTARRDEDLGFMGLFDFSESTYDELSYKVLNWAGEDKNSEKLARAWLDGYEVEQEQLYVVEIPDPNVDGYSIVLGRKEGKVQIKQTLSTTWQMNCSNQLTESEIKQDFAWAWDAGFAKEVE